MAKLLIILGLVILELGLIWLFFFFSSGRRHTRCGRDWSSDVCSSDLGGGTLPAGCGFCLHAFGTAFTGIQSTAPIFRRLGCAPAQLAHRCLSIGNTMPDQRVISDTPTHFAVGQSDRGAITSLAAVTGAAASAETADKQGRTGGQGQRSHQWTGSQGGGAGIAVTRIHPTSPDFYCYSEDRQQDSPDRTTEKVPVRR